MKNKYKIDPINDRDNNDSANSFLFNNEFVIDNTNPIGGNKILTTLKR